MNKFEKNIATDIAPEKFNDNLKPKQEIHKQILSSKEIKEIKNYEQKDNQHISKILKEIEGTSKQNELTEKMDTDKSSLQIKTEKVEKNGQIYTVKYVSKEAIYPAFGYSSWDEATVREDLSPRVKKFVRAHEIYHCQDKSNFGGWIGSEIRANIIPGIKDPIGLLATIKASLSKDRLKFYWQRFKKGQ